MTLHLVAVDPLVDTDPRKFAPKTEAGDFLILISCNESSEPEVLPKYCSCSGTSPPYSRKQTIATMETVLNDIDDTAAIELDARMGNEVVYNLTDFDTCTVLTSAFKYIKNQTEEGSIIGNIDEFIKKLESGVIPTRKNIDGSIYSAPVPPATAAVTTTATTPTDTATAGAVAVPAAEPTIDQALQANDNAGIISLITIIDPALKYLGFSPRYTRSVMLNRNASMKIVTRDLLLCFSGYSHIANNVSKLNSKRVDLPVSQKVMQAINGMQIVKKATQKDHLTLPRLAISFMPAYLLYRKFLVNELQDQTESPINVVYKDIAFYGCTEIRNMNGYVSFHKEFSALIHKPGTETALDDKTFISNYNRWSKIVANGYKNDTQIHAQMNVAINATGMDKGSVINLIEAQLNYYRANP